MTDNNKSRLLWRHLGLVSYEKGMELQEEYHSRLLNDEDDMVLLTLEHTGTITMGRTSSREEVFLSDPELEQKGLELHWTNRGGKCTCHVPGQLVGYPILNIKKLGLAVDTLVRNLEECMIDYLRTVDIEANRDARNPGVWVDDAKIGYIGLNIHKGISSHGFALNINPDLAAFSYFVPCGMNDCKSVSVKKLKGSAYSVDDAAHEIAIKLSSLWGMDLILGAKFEKI